MKSTLNIVLCEIPSIPSELTIVDPHQMQNANNTRKALQLQI